MAILVIIMPAKPAITTAVTTTITTTDSTTLLTPNADHRPHVPLLFYPRAKGPKSSGGTKYVFALE